MSETYQITIKVANSSLSEPIPHAFVTISGPGLSTPVTVGYYPQRMGEGVIGSVATGVSGPGTVKNDSFTHVVTNPDLTKSYLPHPSDKDYTFNVTAQQAMNALQFAAQVANHPGTYQLVGRTDKSNLLMADGYQCTGFARDMAVAAGIQGLVGSGVLAYPGSLSDEFGTLGTNQYQPFRGEPSPTDFAYAVSKIYTGVKTFHSADQTPASWIPAADPNPDLSPTQRNNLAAGLSASGYAVDSVQLETIGSVGMAFEVTVYRDDAGRMVEVRLPGRVGSGGFEALGAPIVSKATPSGTLVSIGIGDPATGMGTPSVATAPGLDTPARISADYITNNGAGSHTVTVGAGGTVSDIWLLQKKAGNVFTLGEFGKAILANNPGITDINVVKTGQVIYIPQKQTDGSVTYSYAGGASMNTNAVNGDYHMVVPNSEGGGQTVYVRTAEGDAGYQVRQTVTNATGATVFASVGFQETLNAEVKNLSTYSLNTDGSYDANTVLDDKLVTFSATPSATELFRLTELKAIDGVAVSDPFVDAAIVNLDINPRDIILGRGTADLAQLVEVKNPSNPTGIYTLTATPGIPWYDIAEVKRLGDVLTSTQALVAALKTGNNLAIAASLTNLHDTVAGTGTSGVGIGLNGLSDFLGLRDALQRGDGLRVIHSGLSLSVDALKAYQYILDYQATAVFDQLVEWNAAPGTVSAVEEAAAEALYDSLSSELAWASDLVQGIGEALPYIGVLLKIDEGKYLEAAALLYAAVYNIPWIGWAIAIGSLLESEPDTVPRGIATLTANGPDGLGIEIALSGNNFGGSEVVHKLMVELMSHLTPVVDKLDGQGLVAERMPVLHFNGGVFTLAVTDPDTGARSVREFNASGGLIGETLNGNWVEIAGGDNYYKNIVGQFVDFATATPGLIVPDWELQTIYRQHQLQIAQAGMTTLARAKADNTLLTGSPGATQEVRPIILNFGDDGTPVSDPTKGGTVQFDVDSDGFAEATNWINPRDGMLVLDRDGDGRITTGHELFTDAGVNMAARGLNVLRELDADGDDMLTSSDPVFGHLQVWIDLNMSGHVEVMDDGSTPELHSLASLGITEIDFNQYRGPNFVMNGAPHALSQVTLTANTQGVLTMVSDAGQWMLNEGGGEKMLPSVKDESKATAPGAESSQSSDATLVSGYDSVKTLEDKTLSISIALLLANDHTATTGLDDASLRVTAVTADAVGAGSVSLDAAKGLVVFTPAANFYGKTGFSYTVTDGHGQFATAHADVDVRSVNDDPVAYNALGDAHLYANEELGNFQLRLGSGVSATGITMVNERTLAGGIDGTWQGGVKIGDTFYSLGQRVGAGGVELYAGEISGTGTVWHPIFKTDPYIYSGTVVGSDIEDGTNLTYKIQHQREDYGVAKIDSHTGAWTFTYTHHDPVSGVVTNEADVAFIVRVTDRTDPAGFYDVEIVVGGRALDRTVITGGEGGTGIPVDPDWGHRREQGVGGRGTGAGAPNKIALGGAAVAMAATIAPVRQEPLALDMDGDGIETNSERDGARVLFDHNGDGIKTGTGWLQPDDGWLVLDLNGNGSIDSGRELFGVDTVLKNGSLATDGFSALRDEDSNADGLIDASDPVFANLRIWRDLNQDGVSQANELSTMVASRIVSIGVSALPFWTDLGNGNVLTDIGSFKRSDGTSGLSGHTTYIAVNLELLINSFVRSFNTAIPLTEQAKALHEIGGSGQVRDLREAVSLSSDLGNWVQSYNQQSTREAQLGMLDTYIQKWADTSTLKSLKQQADALAGSGVHLTYQLVGLTEGSAAYEAFVRKLGIVERFMGFTYGGTSGLPRYTPLDESSGALTVSLAPEQIANVELAYERFKGDIYESSLLTSRLQSFTALIDMTVIEGKALLNFSRMETAFANAITANPQKGLVDLIEFVSAVGENRVATWGWNASAFLAAQINKVSSLSAFTEELSSWTVHFGGPSEHNVFGSGRNDLLVGTSGDDNLSAWEGDDLLFGGAGTDRIYGGGGNNTLDGGSGSDYLMGDDGNDTFLFGPGYGKDDVYDYGGTDAIRLGAGVTPASAHVWRDGSNLYLGVNNDADVITVQSWFVDTANRVETIAFADGTVWATARLAAATFDGTPGPDSIAGTSENNLLFGFAGEDWLDGAAGDDSLDGGTGNDRVYGGLGNDTFAYRSGDGKDILNDDGGTDVIQLGAGITAAGVHLWRDDYSLHLDIGSTTDAVVVEGWFGGTANRIESIQFDGGLTWDVTMLAAATFDGTPGADLISGTIDNNTLNGFGGNDGLYAGGGADILDGGAGADDLYGDGGDDRYIFGRGYGQDSIFESEGNDTVVLAAGLATTDVRLWRDMSSLHLSINGSLDELTIQGWFDVSANRVETIQFVSGAVWNVDALAAAPFAGTPGPDMLFGTPGNDTFFGFEGNDDLYGEAGNDVLDGGIGNDTLDGGAGNDTYLYGRGDGLDTVHDTDLTLSNLDRITLRAGISVGDIALSRDASDLFVDIIGTTDRITVSGWYGSAASRVERLEFANGVVWDEAVLTTARFIGTQGPDAMSTGVSSDFLEGRGGNDALSTDAGDDTLDGGLGDDGLDGGTGNDSYLFGLGYGQDTVTDADGTDVIKLGAGLTPANVQLWRDLSNLYLGIANSSDLLTVQNWFDVAANRVESVQFADGAIWNTATLVAAKFVGTAGADYLTGGVGSDVLEGRGGDDTLMADAGDDTLDGGTGSDNLDGGAGNDSYVFGSGYGQDTITDVAGTDAIKLGAGITPANVQWWRDTSNLYVGIANSADVLTVQGWFDLITNRVESVQFADGTIWNTATLAAAAFGGTPGPDAIYGTAGNDTLLGFGGDDSIVGDAGNDTLDGGTGNDTLDGGAGNDGYVFGLGYGQDSVTDAAGTDVIKLGAGLTTANVQLWRDTSTLYLGITGSTDVLSVQGWFDATSNRVESIQFVDGTIWNATTLATAAFGGTPGADSICGTTGNDTLNGFGGNDSIYADAGNDVLDGGTGDDMLDGGAGNDAYKFGRGYGLDTVAETSGTTDLIQFDANTASTDVLVSRDASHLYLSILGTTDKLTVQNWYADATYQVEKVSFAGGTNWTVASLNAKTTSATEAADFYWGTTGNDTVNGLGGNDQLMGNEGNDALSGGAGNDLIDGGSGTDTMAGGVGDDRYVVDATTDVVTESAGEGYDTVRTTVTYTLGANLERLELLEAGGVINGTGNSLANTLVGNSANNTLTGGTGADTLIGGQGNDTYVVDDAADVVTESLNEGTDLVNASLSWTLSANVEKLTLTGTSAINGTGNELANTLTGNSAANVLTGGAGNDALNGGVGVDTLIGGLGNDSYTVDNAADVTTENLNEGTDTVSSSLSWTLSANLENLTLTGSTLINATGNELNNVLTGNSGANVLTGGAGNDTLKGLAGNDQYIFGRGMGAELVQENDATVGNTDIFKFLSGVSIDQVWLRKEANDLEVSIIGTTDKVTLTNWYLGNQYHVEQFKTADGKTLADTDVQNLVTAMAAYALPAQGQLTLPADYWTALSAVITANWH